jgi:UrcA family protein
MTAFKLFVAALSTAAIFAATATASAQPPDKDVVVTGAESDAVVRQVPYSDLNLASAPGETALVKRVRFAVSDVCLDAVGGHSGYLHESSVNCKSASWAGAAPQIDRAVQRARDIAANGWSAIAPVAITISAR